MRESRLGRWLVGGMLAAAATAFLPSVTAPDGRTWEAMPVAGVEAPEQTDGEPTVEPVAAADEGREESVTPATWEWT